MLQPQLTISVKCVHYSMLQNLCKDGKVQNNSSYIFQYILIIWSMNAIYFSSLTAVLQTANFECKNPLLYDNYNGQILTNKTGTL